MDRGNGHSEMFHLVKEDRYSHLLPLFNGLEHNLAIASIIEGNTLGCMYADDSGPASVAILWNRQEALYLAGDPSTPGVIEGLQRLFHEMILPDTRRRFIPLLSLQVQPAEWEAHLPSILEGCQIEKATRRLYLLQGDSLDFSAKLQPGYSLQRIDAQLLESDLVNRDQVLTWIESFWPSTDAFLERGFGFCVLGRYAVASWCLSVFTNGRRFELGIATDEAYRNHGFASLAGASCLEYCLNNGLIPEWHCWEDNLPSVRVAEKIGLHHSMSYAAYRFSTE
jgi:RimJ/RimL family protein N-acetyltransferase